MPHTEQGEPLAVKLIDLKLSTQTSSLQFGNFRFGNHVLEKYLKEGIVVWCVYVQMAQEKDCRNFQL